ncbi:MULTISPECIES: hypothetical protein [Bacillus]|uniref:hypothetical protein n=1 Tax=Bacillus TaxID=1386 RepID=UPI000B5DB367|nr:MULTISPECIES: hypothetical protein [Bacillus]OXB95536.1 hypothetical protein CGQ22_29055 [Bacillus sp. M13(2017)]QCY60458.1 hypothetical protein FHE73_06540 [Bacillus thuringiensis]
MYTEFENEIRSYEVASFKTLSIEEYQQLLNDKYERFITVEWRPFNVMVAVPHECRICGKVFYNRALNMLGNAEELQHQCFSVFKGSNSESEKVRKRRLAEIEKVKQKLKNKVRKEI